MSRIAEMVVTAKALLLVGVGAAIVFPAVIAIEGARRPGYRPAYHTGSELELGERGWVQRANFLLMGLGVFAFALGAHWTLNAVVGPVLLAVFGCGMIVAGVFPPDPGRGYPPGPESAPVSSPSCQHRLHHVFGGPVAFLALSAACLVLAGSLAGPWLIYTGFTAVAGLVMTVWTALAYQRDAANTGLVQRGLILVYWSWFVVMGIHLAIYSS